MVLPMSELIVDLFMARLLSYSCSSRDPAPGYNLASLYGVLDSLRLLGRDSLAETDELIINKPSDLSTMWQVKCADAPPARVKSSVAGGLVPGS